MILEVTDDVDSCVTALLCSRAVTGSRLHAIYLLNRETHSQTALRNINRIARMGKFNLSIIEITTLFRNIVRELPMIRKGRPPGDSSTRERIATDFLSRLKMSILYYYSDTYQQLVCNSVNKSDFILGRAPMWGNFAGDLNPLISIYKTQVDMVARLLRVGFMVAPMGSFVTYLGSEVEASYYEVDPILLGVQKDWRDEDIAEDLGADLQTVQLTREMFESSRHRRESVVSDRLEIGPSSAEG